MLGWEYPPHISGGLGTACEGLTRALALRNIRLQFIVPALHGDENAPHMRISDSKNLAGKSLTSGGNSYVNATAESDTVKSNNVTIERVSSPLSPYLNPERYKDVVGALAIMAEQGGNSENASSGAHYGNDLFSEVERYSSGVCKLYADSDFDVIHAHDWMTFPAAIALAKRSGKPLIVHVHSLEYDRSGYNVNSYIHDIERMGLNAADAVIAVSSYTRKVICEQHGVSPDKIFIVHNGIELEPSTSRTNISAKASKLVLFLGRITFQKGPEYFVRAACEVLKHEPRAKFVMAGDGDLLPGMKQLVKDLGLEARFEFPGFLRGAAVDEMLAKAAVFVMPSVSEPFGIAPLEAISCNTPVIISRQSGISEVLSHALKVDFWDVNRLAALIVNALRYPEMREDLTTYAQKEVQQIHWDSAAKKVHGVYRQVLHC